MAYFKRSSTWSEVLGLSSGGTPTSRNRLKENKFLSLQIPLPSLGEQQRIVARVDELAAKIESARVLRSETKFQMEALLASAYRDVFSSRSHWQESELQTFCEETQYGFTASATTQQIGPHLLRITDIQNGQVNWKSVPYCVCPKPKNYLLQKGDLLFARTGATTGKSFLIGDCPESVFASYLIRVRVRDSVSVEYLYKFFQSPYYWNQITEGKEGTGQPNVNGAKLSALRVSIPPPEEQEAIVSHLDALQAKVQALRAWQNETSRELDALLPSILDKAFKGEL